MKANEVRSPCPRSGFRQACPCERGRLSSQQVAQPVLHRRCIANDANNASSGETMVIYRSASTGYMYARHLEEFLDNNGEKYRFERLVKASPESEKV
jgi:hypothetical protein